MPQTSTLRPTTLHTQQTRTNHKTRHKQMLASTMQHSTHHHTPNPPHHHHTHTPQHGSRCVRRSRPGAATTRKPHQPTAGVLSGPNSAPNSSTPPRGLALCSTQPHPPPTSRM